MRFLKQIFEVWTSLRYLLTFRFRRDLSSLAATAQRNERYTCEQLDVLIQIERNWNNMTNKIDQLNEALEQTNNEVGKILDIANLMVAVSEKNQAELKDAIEKIKAGETDVTPQLEKALALNEKLATAGAAFKQALDTQNVTDTLYDDINEVLPEETEQPSEQA